MKKNTVKIVAFILCIMLIIPNFVYALDTDSYKDIYKNEGTSKVTDMGGSILAVVQVIGVSVGMIMLIILGIKYMWMSSNAGDKASIKEKLIPYVIGAVIMFGGTGILTIIANFAQNMGN